MGKAGPGVATQVQGSVPAIAPVVSSLNRLRGVQAQEQAGGKQQEARGEALDVFMDGLANDGAADDLKRLQHQLRLTHEQMKQTDELIKIADPLGHFKRPAP